MRLLLDTCIGAAARDHLQGIGHEIVWAAEWEVDPCDPEILDRAYAERRVLVTLDRDFGELAVVRGLAHRGIVRLVGLPTRVQGPPCARALARYARELGEGAILTVAKERIRVRPGPAERQEPGSR